MFHRFRHDKFASGQFLLLLQMPQKIKLGTKVAKIGSKMIISLPWSKSVEQTVSTIWKLLYLTWSSLMNFWILKRDIFINFCHVRRIIKHFTLKSVKKYFFLKKWANLWHQIYLLQFEVKKKSFHISQGFAAMAFWKLCPQRIILHSFVHVASATYCFCHQDRKFTIEIERRIVRWERKCVRARESKMRKKREWESERARKREWEREEDWENEN